jgi:lipid II:glycine glycyltransferase (peptidoglycan interpeptide bridge formation enzyme)
MKPDRTIRLASPEDKTLWNSVVAHPLQTWEWGEFREKMGIHVVRVGVYEKNTLVDGWQVTFHPIPHTSFTIGYFPKGPVPTQDMIRSLTEIGRHHHAIYIQFEPNCTIEIFRKHEKLLLSPSFIPSHHPMFSKYSYILDLAKSEETLLASMHSKTRYNIKIAQKHAVEIKQDCSNDAFNEFVRLSEETTKRQGFFAHNKTYQTAMWNTMKKNGLATLFTAKFEHETLAAWILFSLHDTIYYPYGASARTHRDVMAPNLLLWEIAKWAKQKGFLYFDLWGALGDTPDPNDPWYGFHRFKQGYAPIHIEYAGSYDCIIQPFFYSVYIILDKIRWFLLQHKRS